MLHQQPSPRPLAVHQSSRFSAPRLAAGLLVCFGSLLQIAATAEAQQRTTASSRTTVAGQQAKVTRFYVVRHAEKVDDSQDPELSAAGKQRAQDLAERLKDAEIGAAYTTPYIRTRETARPTADARQLKLQEFPPQQPGDAAKAWAKELLAANEGKNVLIVAHSGRPDQRGSVPSLVAALSGAEDIAAITDSEYFNLYIVTVTTEGDATQIEVKHEKYGLVPDDQAGG